MMSPSRKQKKYTQKYRTNWEFMDDFKGWLKPLPDDILKARCAVCNVVINAHLCDLKKHGSSKKHLNALHLVKTLNNFNEHSEEKDSDLNFLRDSNQDVEEEGSEEENVSEENNHWSKESIESLIKHTKIYWKDLQNGLRKKKDVWDDICMGVVCDGFSFNSSECNKKFRNLKVRYFDDIERSFSGDNFNIRNPYFDDLDEILANDPQTISHLEKQKESLKIEVMEGDLSAGAILMDEPCIDGFAEGDCTITVTNYDSLWSDEAVELLLDNLVDFKDYFSGKEGENEEDVWQIVKYQMHQHGYIYDENQCRKKWHSLVKKFNECQLSFETTGTVPTWAYFTRVRHILNTVKIPTQNSDKFYSISAKRSRKRGRKKKTIEEMTFGEDSDASDGESLNPFKRKFEQFLDDDNISNKSSKNNKTKITVTATSNNINNNNNNKSINYREKETLRMMRHLTDTASLWHKMNSIETKLDDLSDYHEIQSQTNSLLSQILNEISALANNLSPTTHDSVNNVQEGFTLVLPNSNQTLH